MFHLLKFASLEDGLITPARNEPITDETNMWSQVTIFLFTK